MNRSQRVLIITGSLLVGGFLNVSFCDWAFRDSATSARVIVAYAHESFLGPVTIARRRRSIKKPYTGLLVQPMSDRSTAIIAGTVAPLTLVVVTAYLMIGWRAERRQRVNHCRECGYDLRGTKSPYVGRCPECGTTSIMSHPHRAVAA